MASTRQWQLLETLVVLKNRWLTVIGERLLDDRGKELTYWRAERSDSVIVIPIHNGMFILPEPVYRPGVGKLTYDFPGGRHENGTTPIQTAYMVLERELGVIRHHVDKMLPLNDEPWLVDTSFSSQRLFVFVAMLVDATDIEAERVAIQCPVKEPETILRMVPCLQCRCALLEWMHGSKRIKRIG